MEGGQYPLAPGDFRWWLISAAREGQRRAERGTNQPAGKGKPAAWETQQCSRRATIFGTIAASANAYGRVWVANFSGPYGGSNFCSGPYGVWPRMAYKSPLPPQPRNNFTLGRFWSSLLSLNVFSYIWKKQFIAELVGLQLLWWCWAPHLTKKRLRANKFKKKQFFNNKI